MPTPGASTPSCSMCERPTSGRPATHRVRSGCVWANSRAARFEIPINRRIVCVCRSGARSAKATEQLVQWGFDAANMVGGMKAWAAQGLPVVRDDDTPGQVI